MFANEGDEALEMLSQYHDIDVVVSEIHLNKTNAFNMLEQIRSKSPDTRVIILSHQPSDTAVFRRMMQVGACDFVAKPIDFTDLDKSIVRATRSV